MKKTKKAAPENANREPSEPVGNVETANGAAKCARPVFVSEEDAAEMPNFEPSPRLYACACAFIWDAAQTAFSNGENDLLSRDGIADALQYIAKGDAGTDAESYGEILEEWREVKARKISALAELKQAGDIAPTVARLLFWQLFDETKRANADALRERAYYLSCPHTGELIRDMKNAAGVVGNAFIDKMTDAIIYGGAGTENPNPARVRAEWLNSVFVLAGESLAQWVAVAALPDYSDTLAEIKKAIADNFGVFPAPFAVKKISCGDYVELARREIEKLCFIARALQREKQAANGRTLTDAGEPIAGHIGTWARAQGATAYYIGVSVCIRGTKCPLPPTNQKRGRMIADLIESEDYLGAVKCDIHSAMGGDTSGAEYEKIRRFLERVNAGKVGKRADRKFSGCWHIAPAPVGGKPSGGKVLPRKG